MVILRGLKKEIFYCLLCFFCISCKEDVKPKTVNPDNVVSELLIESSARADGLERVFNPKTKSSISHGFFKADLFVEGKKIIELSSADAQGFYFLNTDSKKNLNWFSAFVSDKTDAFFSRDIKVFKDGTAVGAFFTRASQLKYFTGLSRETKNFDLSGANCHVVFYKLSQNAELIDFFAIPTPTSSGADTGSISELGLDQEENIYFSGFLPSRSSVRQGAFSWDVANGNDIFFGKLDRQFRLKWMKFIGDVGGERAWGMDVTAQGHLSIAMFSRNARSYQGVTISPDITSQYGVVLQVDSDGNYRWHKNLISQGGSASIYDVISTKTGELYITGFASGTQVSLDNFSFSPTGIDAYVAQLDIKTGHLKQARVFNSAGNQLGLGLNIFNETLFLSGTYASNFEVTSQISLKPIPSNSAFIISLSKEMNLLDAFGFGLSSSNEFWYTDFNELGELIFSAPVNGNGEIGGRTFSTAAQATLLGKIQ